MNMTVLLSVVKKTSFRIWIYIIGVTLWFLLHLYLNSDQFQKEIEPVLVPLVLKTAEQEQVFFTTEQRVTKRSVNFTKTVKKPIPLLETLSSLVQNRIMTLQNPQDCEAARKLICTMAEEDCNFPCHVHHIIYCLITSYATGRTMILHWPSWKYGTDGFLQVFRPLSEKCTYASGYMDDVFVWYGNDDKQEDEQVITVPRVNKLKHQLGFLPVTIPADIGDMLEKVHKEPHVWWTGQFGQYFLRSRTLMNAVLDEYKKTLELVSPTVGVYVHENMSLELTVQQVKEYFETRALLHSLRDEIQERRVFLANDVDERFPEAVQAFQVANFIVVGEKGRRALQERFHETVILQILLEIFLLAACDFLFCPLSYPTCALSYELMQAKGNGDVKIAPFGHVYHFDGGKKLLDLALEDHLAETASQLHFRKGDQIYPYQRMGNMSYGRNKNTRKKGFYPSNKVKPLVRKLEFPPRHLKWWDDEGSLKDRHFSKPWFAHNKTRTKNSKARRLLYRNSEEIVERGAN